MTGDPWADYDAWKTTLPDWHMPSHIRRAADETQWRMRRRIDWHAAKRGDQGGGDIRILASRWRRLSISFFMSWMTSRVP